MKKRYVLVGVVIGGWGIAAWINRNRIIDKLISYIPELDDSYQGQALPVPGSKEWTDALRDIIHQKGMGQFVAAVSDAAKRMQAESDVDDVCIEHALSTNDCSHLHGRGNYRVADLEEEPS